MFDWPPLTLHAVAVAPDPNSNHARTKHLERHFGVGIVPAQISDNQSIGIVAAINRRERARTRTSIESLRQLLELSNSEQPRLEWTVSADHSGRTILTAPHIMRDDEGSETGPSTDIIPIEYHWYSPIGLTLLNGLAVGTAGSGTGGAKAGPGGTAGTWIWVARSNHSQMNGLAWPPRGIPRYSRLKSSSPSARRSCSRNSAENVSILSAVAFNRIHDCSSPAHAVQNGSVRLHAVDSMANRACGRRARIGRKAAIRSLGSRAASSATIQPSTVSPRIESSLLGSARTRDPFFSSNAKTLSLSSSAPALMRLSRTRRTASALCRCAGHPITDNDPGVKTIKCAMAHAAVEVLPTGRAVSARMEAPRG